ncbi:MAG: hypothetical protein AAF701_08085, partial [Pseudomonadota bacterium]
MKQALQLYLDHLRQGGVLCTSWLNHGTQDLSAFSKYTNIALHDDLKILWAHFDGMTIPEDVVLSQTWLDGTYTYFSVDQALNDYETTLALWDDSPETFEDYWPKGFVPLGSP